VTSSVTSSEIFTQTMQELAQNTELCWLDFGVAFIDFEKHQNKWL